MLLREGSSDYHPLRTGGPEVFRDTGEVWFSIIVRRKRVNIDQEANLILFKPGFEGRLNKVVSKSVCKSQGGNPPMKTRDSI